jgi:phage shock protein E
VSFDPWMVAATAAAFLVLPRVLGLGRARASTVGEKLAAGAMVLDVRSQAEFRGGAYPGARNIPLQELAGRLSEIPKGRPIVAYCASGIRSAAAVKLLRRSGHEDVVNGGGLRHMPRPPGGPAGGR